MTRTEALIHLAAGMAARGNMGTDAVADFALQTLNDLEQLSANPDGDPYPLKFDPEADDDPGPAARGVRIVVTNPKGLAVFNMEAGTAADMLEGSAANFWELGDGYRLFVAREGERA